MRFWKLKTARFLFVLSLASFMALAFVESSDDACDPGVGNKI